MRKLLTVISAGIILAACSTANNTATMNDAPNTLTAKEQRDGWQLLFDGSTTNGWHTYQKTGVGKAWKTDGGALYLDASVKNSGGDIVTDEAFNDFHFIYDWKISKNGNSGVMFYVQEDSKFQYPWNTGAEMQVLDNDGHADGKIIKHRAGDLYDLITAKETVRPVGEWNRAEIVSKKGDLKFYLNGVETLHTTMWDENWKNMIANSKFKSMVGFGSFKSGKIALQDHGNDVWFRNLKIKKL
jgi:hypothetical protein